MFEEDLEYGERGERYVMKTLSDYFHESIKKNPNKESKDYDLIGGVHTFEVKRDKMFKETDNVALEIGHKGKPSGVLWTKADYWVLLLEEDIWIAPLKTLREWVFSGSAPTVKGGDDNNSKIVLMDKKELDKAFVRIN